MTTPLDVAKWMSDQLDKDGIIYQEYIVGDIEQHFGEDFVYPNENGNPAISRSVLRAFRKLTENTAVWSRSERCWTKRNQYDPPGRQQD